MPPKTRLQASFASVVATSKPRQNITVSDSGSLDASEVLKRLARKSTPREWLQRGTLYFEHHLYEQAAYCFSTSGHEENRLLCEAYLKRQSAQQSMDMGNANRGRKLYYEAAELFQNLGRIKAAVKSLLDGCYFIQAGELLESEGEFLPAADAFVRGNNYCRAAGCMEAAKKYTEAIKLYKDGGLTRIAVNKLKSSEYRDKVDTRVLNRIVELFCLPMLSKPECVNDPELNDKIYEALSMISTESRERFLVEHGYVNKLMEFNEKFNNKFNKKLDYQKIAELFYKNGQCKDGAEYFLKAAQDFADSTFQIEITDSGVRTQKCLVESFAECQMQFIWEQVREIYPNFQPFDIQNEIPLANIKELFEEALCHFERAKETLCHFKSSRIGDITSNQNDIINAEKIEYSILEDKWKSVRPSSVSNIIQNVFL